MEMYYVREYTPTSRFLKIINSTLTALVDYFLESTVGVYCLAEKQQHFILLSLVVYHMKNADIVWCRNLRNANEQISPYFWLFEVSKSKLKTRLDFYQNKCEANANTTEQNT